MRIEDLEELLNSRIIAAYSGGMSVVEINRALGRSRVEFVHGLLRDTGYIQPMARSEYRRTYDIDFRFSSVLRKMGYSFGRWCLGWKMDPSSAAVDLKTQPKNGEITAAHEALRRDFPEVHFRIFGGPSPKRRPRAGEFSSPPTVMIAWDMTRDGYVAKIVEHPTVEEIGVDWEHAVERIRTAYGLFERITKLNKAIRLKATE
ncbi:hypothetical protein [Geobacter sp. DSM 9736]|uniref:hypothetical protein n=1 Tax=Geobacter sp. DSM 9736 TaxID=1277350 RepID=UPI000B50C0F0|nr:hypothetical protein [Geobacter sp. DSM 9736]SNB45413.1 hypothetical protein SAMN06269301_0826 [Geobacter sp. DSM 9736]